MPIDLNGHMMLLIEVYFVFVCGHKRQDFVVPKDVIFLNQVLGNQLENCSGINCTLDFEYFTADIHLDIIKNIFFARVLCIYHDDHID